FSGRALGIRVPLAVFFVSHAGTLLDRRVKSVEYVEKTGILGAPAHHLVGRTDTVNFQIWIADGDQPLPQRLVLTYPKAPGQPQFRAQFVDWNVAPEAADTVFAFAPPAGANRIPFAAALSQAGRGTTGASEKQGAKPSPREAGPRCSPRHWPWRSSRRPRTTRPRSGEAVAAVAAAREAVHRPAASRAKAPRRAAASRPRRGPGRPRKRAARIRRPDRSPAR